MDSKFKKGDLVKIWSPNPTIIGKRIPRRIIDRNYENELKLDEVADFNHGKVGVIVKIDFCKTDNPIYTVFINGHPEAYGQHFLRKVK